MQPFMNNRLKLATEDLMTGILQWRIWMLLGWQDIRLRYRRSQLGPFWITLSMAITIYTMGFLYGHLFKMDLAHYFPFLATGILTWAFISTVINESTTSFIDSSNYLKQIKLPFTVFVLRILTRNLIIFAHNILAIIPIIIYFHIPINWHTCFALLGLIVLTINGFIYGFILAMLGSRFRDIGQIVTSITPVIFFLTPIMWSPGLLPQRYKFVVQLNPFAQFIELVRNPLMGMLPSHFAISVAFGITLFGSLILMTMLYRARHRIIFWL